MTNRFKGWNMIDREPEELQTEVCNIVQEVVIKTTPKKKKRKKTKWFSEEALQIAEKREATTCIVTSYIYVFICVYICVHILDYMFTARLLHQVPLYNLFLVVSENEWYLEALILSGLQCPFFSTTSNFKLRKEIMGNRWDLGEERCEMIVLEDRRA